MKPEKRMRMSTDKKRWINIVLSLIGIAIVILYSICEESCRYLQGSLFSIDLKYLGIFYMGMLTGLNFLKKGIIFLLFLSLGMGAELYLIGFQIKNSVYCSYCISFGAIIAVLFLLNFEWTKKVLITISLAIGFILFSFLFKGATTPVYAEDFPMPSFGNGQIKVRLYTDYFCGPCRSLESQLEDMIKDLVRKNVITTTFIDTPIHPPHTNLYAKYFLYILYEKNDFVHALRARAILFEAAKNNITGKEKLEAFLKKKGIRFKPFDIRPTLSILNSYLQGDTINATPTCVIYRGGKKDTYTGPANIVKALRSIH